MASFFRAAVRGGFVWSRHAGTAMTAWAGPNGFVFSSRAAAVGSFGYSCGERNRSPADALFGKEEHSGRPRLILYTHRLTGFAMVPFVEFAAQVQLSQRVQG